MPDEKYTEKTLDDAKYYERLHGDVKDTSPIIIAMHWLTGSYTVLDFLFENMPTPARLIFIQGQYASMHEAGGYSWFPDGMAFYEKSEAEHAPVIREETAKVAAFITKLKAQHKGKVIVTGMSQGGDISLHLAAYHPNLIDVAIPLAGRLSEPMQPEAIQEGDLPIVHMQQGADDKIVTPESAEAVKTWLSQQGFDVELDVYEGVGHDISAEMVSRIQDIIAAS